MTPEMITEARALLECLRDRRRWDGNPKVLHALNRASERLERREDKDNEYLKA